MKVTDIDSQKILLDEKDIKIFKIMAFHTKTFRVWFNKIHGFIKIYDVTRYLVILGPSWFDEICNSFKYLINEKKGIADSISYNLAIIRLDSCNSLPIEKNRLS